MLVPGGDEEPEGGGRELDGGDGVGWGVRELVLCWEAVNFEDTEYGKIGDALRVDIFNGGC